MSTTAAPVRRPLLALTAGPHPLSPAAPPVAAAEQRPRGTAPVPTPRLHGETTRTLAPPLTSVARPSEVLAWLSAAPRVVGEPVSVSVSALTRDAHVHVASAAEFVAWCEYLRIAPGAARRATSVLGPMAEASTTTNGWALHVRLFGTPVEELS